MMISRNDEGSVFVHNEHPHCITKTMCIHGVSQQILKQNTGNFINYDYETLHYLDQMK